MTIRSTISMALALTVPTVLMLTAFSAQDTRAATITVNQTTARKLFLTAGKSLIIDDPGPGEMSFASAAPEIVEVMRLPTGQIYLRGRTPGLTTLSVCEKERVSAIFEIEVSPDISRLENSIRKILPSEKDLHVSADNEWITLSGSVSSPKSLSRLLALAEPYAPEKVNNLLTVHLVPESGRLKEKLAEILPREKGIRVIESNGMLTLSGTVSSAVNLSQTLAVAESYAPEKIVNLLEVGGVQQVMLELRFAEMSRSLTKRMGINFNALSSSGRNIGLSLLNNLTSIDAVSNDLVFVPGINQGVPVGGSVGDAINGVIRFLGDGVTWTVFIDALKESGLVKILAEPTLITLSGQKAVFLAGGDFPFPVPQENCAFSIEFKEYGVGLSFTPTVLGDGKISLNVAPEVSNLDFSTAVFISGFVVPGLNTRRVETSIELADGQSFAIAGLLQENVREVVSKFPILGELPVLGALFRSSSFQKNETELIVIATPHLVKPLDMGRQPLPTDQFVEPNDFEFYLLGQLESLEPGNPSSTPAARGSLSERTDGLDGEFGHIIPK
jgi:pilus assembly protein CpaC